MILYNMNNYYLRKCLMCKHVIILLKKKKYLWLLMYLIIFYNQRLSECVEQGSLIKYFLLHFRDSKSYLNDILSTFIFLLIFFF